jgi:HTH-type transcriptional regulator, sugar sensing transcriptional regulator
VNTDISINFQKLGLTQLESDIYIFLLKHGLSTGYAIAKGINKPAANVYKALETLGQKGGVVSSLGNNKTFNAVAWQELLDKHKKQFSDNIDALSEQLKSFDQPEVDEQVYQMNNREQVIETTLSMLDAAQSLILADVEPDALPLFADALINAAKRGVEVRVKLYEPADLPCVIVSLRRHCDSIHNKSADVAFSFSCDGYQFVLAMLSDDGNNVIQAFQSHSALMNITMHTQILYGQVLTDLKQFLKDDDLISAKAVLSDTEHLHPMSADNLVFKRYKDRYNI